MKKKEIDVYVENYDSKYDINVYKKEEIEDDFDEGYTFITKRNLLKGKLIVEVPEKKIEITESQLKYAVKKVFDYSVALNPQIIFNDLKKALGFDHE